MTFDGCTILLIYLNNVHDFGVSLQDISPKKLAIIMIAAGVILVFAFSGFQARNVFVPSVTEETQVVIKNQNNVCVVEASDDVPRNIPDCPYNIGDTISITYKPQQPSIEKHSLIRSGN
jgi:hypothetical protein